MWLKCLHHEKLLCFLGGAVAVVVGTKTLKSKTARELCVKGLAKGIKIGRDAQEALQNMREEAADLVHDAERKAETAE